MSSFAQLAKDKLTLLEKYLFSEDRQTFLDSLTPTDRKFFSLLLDPSQENSNEIMTALGIAQYFRPQIDAAKLMKEIRTAEGEK